MTKSECPFMPQGATKHGFDLFRYTLEKPDRDLFDAWQDTVTTEAQKELYDILSTEARLKVAQIVHVYGFYNSQLIAKAHREAIKLRQDNDDLPGQTIAGAIQRAAEMGLTAEQMKEVLLRQIALSLTAHPTQYNLPEHVQARQVLAKAIQKDDPSKDEITEALSLLLNTPAGFAEKKIPQQELLENLEHATNLFWVLPGLLDSVRKSLDIVHRQFPNNGYGYIFTGIEPDIKSIVLRLWPCVDRDGNPAITTMVTTLGIAQSQEKIVDLYINSIDYICKLNGDKAPRKVTFDRLQRLKQALIDGSISPKNDADMEKFGLLLTTCLKVEDGDEASKQLRWLDMRARVFRWHLGKFQPRQEAGAHTQAVAAIGPLLQFENGFEDTAYNANMPQPEKQQQLQKILAAIKNANIGTLDRLNKTISDQLSIVSPQIYKNYTIFNLISENPAHFCDYIISNAGKPSDVLEVLVLAKLAGAEQTINIRMLCETLTDLKAMPQTLETLLAIPEYRDFIKQNHNNRLPVMIALSDTQRQHGPAIIFDQILTMVDLCKVALKHEIELEIMWGGSDDLYRGGGDISMYPYYLARSIVGYAATTNQKLSKLAACVREVSFTLQGRQVEDVIGNTASAWRLGERMFAAATNFYSFLRGEHTAQFQLDLAEEYQANEAARDALQPCMRAYEFMRGPLLDTLSLAVVPAAAVKKLNTSSRPDKRPTVIGNPDPREIDALPLTDTRAITNQFAVQLPGLEINGWFGLTQLADLDARIVQNSPILQEMLKRALICLERTYLEKVWMFSGLTPPASCIAALYDTAFNQVWQRELQLSINGKLDQTNKLIQFDFNKYMPVVLQQLDLDDTLINRQTVLLTWLEAEYKRTEKVVCRKFFNNPKFSSQSAREAVKTFPRLSEELVLQKRNIAPMQTWLAMATTELYQTPQPTQAQLTALQAFAQVIAEGTRTPNAYINHTPGFEPDMRKVSDHLSKFGPKTFAVTI